MEGNMVLGAICAVGYYSYSTYKIVKGECPDLQNWEKIERGDLKDFTDQTARAMGISKPVDLYRIPARAPIQENREERQIDLIQLHMRKVAQIALPSYFGSPLLPGKMGVAIPAINAEDQQLPVDQAKYLIARNLMHIKRNDTLFSSILPLIAAIAVTILLFPLSSLLALVAGWAVNYFASIPLGRWRAAHTEIKTLNHCPPEVQRGALAFHEHIATKIQQIKDRCIDHQRHNEQGQPQAPFKAYLFKALTPFITCVQRVTEESVNNVRQALQPA